MDHDYVIEVMTPEMEINTLIELYRAHPILYDSSNMSYKDQLMKDNVWEEISLAMGQGNWTVEACTKKMKYLRDQFVEHSKEPPSGSGAPGKRKWPFLSAMSWILPFIKRRRTMGNIATVCKIATNVKGTSSCMPAPNSLLSTSVGNVGVAGENLSPRPTIQGDASTSTAVNKRQTGRPTNQKPELMGILESSLKFMEQIAESKKRKTEDSDSEDELFLKSVLKTVKRMSKKNKKEAKQRILAIAMELDDS